MKNKTFMEVIKEQNKDEVLYIGAEKGSGFVYIETAEKVIENMDRLEKYLRAKAERSLSDAKTKINNLPGRIVELKGQIAIEEDEGERKKLESKVLDSEETFAGAVHSRRKYTKILNSWVKLPDRKVASVYEHETDIPGQTIIFKGWDVGELWFKDEKEIIF